MKKIFSVLLFCLIGLNFSYAHGPGENHHRPGILDDFGLIEKAKRDIAFIVDKKEKIEAQLLDKSWKNLPKENIKIITKKNGAVVMAFKNKHNKKTLFVLLLDHGQYVSANFTGNFKGL